MINNPDENLSNFEARQKAERAQAFIQMVVNKKEQLFGKSSVSPKRPDYSSRLQKNIDIFF